MLFIKYFNILSFLVFEFLLFSTADAQVVEKKCGKHIFQVKISNETKVLERHYELYYQNTGHEKKLLYKGESGIGLDAACIQNNKKQYLLLFQESCGGNGCSEEVYSIVDPDNGKIIIKGENWANGNKKEVEEFIGYPPPFYTENIFFCCYKI